MVTNRRDKGDKPQWTLAFNNPLILEAFKNLLPFVIGAVAR